MEFITLFKSNKFNIFIILLLIVFGWQAAGSVSDDDRTNRIPELRVALLGDTGAGTNFGSVLSLVVSEKSDVVMINGDFGYGASPAAWKKRLESTIDVKVFPVIGSLGNHDISKVNEYITVFTGFRSEQNGLATACTGGPKVAEGQDIVLIDEVCTFGNVSIIASGIGQVLRKPYLEDRLASKLKQVPDGNWKLVGYHGTLPEMNPGLKSLSASYRFFDLIRQAGAIGAQAHTHSVMASCPISSVFAKGTPVRYRK